jgi:hypothetical protein
MPKILTVILKIIYDIGKSRVVRLKMLRNPDSVQRTPCNRHEP